MLWMVKKCLVMGALTLVGCGSNPSTSVTTAPSPARTAFVFTGEESFELGQTQVGTDGCHWLSADASRVACVVHVLDMGFVTSDVAIRRLADGKTVASHQIFDGSSESPEGVKHGPLAALNAAMAKDGFALEGTHEPRDGLRSVVGAGPDRVRVTLAARSAAAPRPQPTGDDQTRRCCEMLPEGATVFERAGVVAVQFGIRCRFTGDPAERSSGCFLDGYNDESHPFESAVGFVKP